MLPPRDCNLIEGGPSIMFIQIIFQAIITSLPLLCSAVSTSIVKISLTFQPCSPSLPMWTIITLFCPPNYSNRLCDSSLEITLPSTSIISNWHWPHCNSFFFLITFLTATEEALMFLWWPYFILWLFSIHFSWRLHFWFYPAAHGVDHFSNTAV